MDEKDAVDREALAVWEAMQERVYALCSHCCDIVDTTIRFADDRMVPHVILSELAWRCMNCKRYGAQTSGAGKYAWRMFEPKYQPAMTLEEVLDQLQEILTYETMG